MTYISRGTRIISSRWLDECDAEYKLRASRKRSEGRLKRHSSCDDLRAWNICGYVNYSYLLDLMSDGESTGRGRVRLYGRYVPVPLLLKILRNFNENTAEQKFKEKEISNNKNSKGNQEASFFRSSQEGKTTEVFAGENNGSGGNQSCDQKNRSDGYQIDNINRDESLLRTQCEKYLLERRFSKCRSLLCKAVGKLEKIDGIICDQSIERDNKRNKEIESAFRRAKSVCNCSASGSQSHLNSASEPTLERSVRDGSRCTELLQKISELKQKLKVIKEKRQKVSEQIRLKRAEKCDSSSQVTQLFSRREEVKLKKLRDKLEKLVSRKVQLLLELSKTIILFNKCKKFPERSKLTLSSDSKTVLGDDDFQCKIPVSCACGCQCTDHLESPNSLISEDASGEDCSEKTFFTDSYYKNSSKNLLKRTEKCNAGNEDLTNRNDENGQSRMENHKNNRAFLDMSSSESPKRKTRTDIKESNEYRDSEDGYAKENQSKTKKKSKLKFTCPETKCRDISFSENIDDLQNNHFVLQQKKNPEQSLGRNHISKNIENSRPYTSPSTTSKSFKSEIPERKFKSETTMEEIEKTLRNYEQRLRKVDSLEFKIMRMKEKVIEGDSQREDWLRQKAKNKKLREAEKEQSKKKLLELYSENWALKKRLEELQNQSDIQMKEIECLQVTRMKLREAECELEDLRKELTKYQGSFVGQKNRIRMLENCIVNQRTEIEDLTKLINAVPAKCCQDKCVQKSRSNSPESLRTTKTYSEPNNQVWETRFSQSSEEDETWCCVGRRQDHVMKSQQTMSISPSPCCLPRGNRKREKCGY